MSKKCKSGEILKDGYVRKAHKRNEYKRSNGVVVKSSRVPETHVAATCVKDTGKPGKGPKILPKLNDNLKISKYGYSIHKSEPVRRAALREASRDNDTLEVLRKLNLIRNYQSDKKNKEIFSKDVEYMKKLYAKSKKQRGGDNDLIDNELISSDDIITVNLPENRKIKIDTVISSDEVCDDDKCTTTNNVYETHTIDNTEVIFRTIKKSDSEQILDLDQTYYDPNTTNSLVVDMIDRNAGNIIGIEVGGKLQGYCVFKDLGADTTSDNVSNKGIYILWFCANKGFGTPLYKFLEKYFKMNNHKQISAIVNLNTESEIASRLINFWNKMGFETLIVSGFDGLILMGKVI